MKTSICFFLFSIFAFSGSAQSQETLVYGEGVLDRCAHHVSYVCQNANQLNGSNPLYRKLCVTVGGYGYICYATTNCKEPLLINAAVYCPKNVGKSTTSTSTVVTLSDQQLSTTPVIIASNPYNGPTKINIKTNGYRLVKLNANTFGFYRF